MDLRNNETMVDVTRNESTMGDSNRRKRSADSCYLLAGGSSDTYSVTVNFESGHFCKVDGGEACKGNLHGKARKYGAINARDTRNPVEWCKHVSASLANTEAVAEAQEITAQAFGKKTAKVTIAKPVAAFPDHSVPEAIVAEVEATDARERLATLEAERAALLESIATEEATELRTSIAALVKRFDYDRVREAIKEVA